MKGSQPTISDIELDLQDIVCPVSLECDEVLSPEEADPVNPYRVEATCYNCEKELRLFVVTTTTGIRGLQRLLIDNLTLLCPPCSRLVFRSRHGK